ncbi:MAG: hypothetical protein KatS3mg105_0510 [Gemmatales bacterium]|nr:MAG: hypothetical protein KatS3mg105_0510 [Gemmatales bacterium]
MSHMQGPMKASPEKANRTSMLLEEPTRIYTARLTGDGSLISIPGYEIQEELGRGGMGVVYKATQTGLKRTVALKMILNGPEASASEQRRFRQEAEAVARLQHPNIVQVYEIGDFAGRPYFSLEYVNGGSLARKLEATPMPHRQAAALVATLARAIHAAHQQGIVHRDLKPANILLQIHGQECLPKISDFGLAKRLDTDTGQTRSGSIMGTPSYMAPEQAAGKSKQITPLVDVYALGAILYEALTGRPPFRGATVLETLEQVRTQPPVPPGRLQPRVPRDLETIVMKCLAKECRRRYQSAEALADDLERFLAGKPILARPVNLWQRGMFWCKRNPALAATGVLAFVALTLGTAVSSFFAVTRSQLASELECSVAQLQKAKEAAMQNLELAHTNLAAAERANANFRLSIRQSAGLLLEQGLTLAQQGQAHHGALLMARCLELAPADAHDLIWSARTNLNAWSSVISPLQQIHSNVVAVSPDLTLIVKRIEPDAIQLWDPLHDRSLGFPMRHPAGIRQTYLGPTQLVLTVDAEETKRLWSARTGRVIGVLPGKGDVLAAYFAADGSRLITLTSLAEEKLEGRLWDTATASPLGSAWLGTSEVRFSPDAKRFLARRYRPELTSNETELFLWNAETGKLLAPLEHQGTFAQVRFSPDGKWIATVGATAAALLWDSGNGKRLVALKPQSAKLESSVNRLLFSPDSRFLLVVLDNTAWLWQLMPYRRNPASAVNTDNETHESRRKLEIGERIEVAAFDTSGGRVLLAGENGTVRLFDTQSGEPIGPTWRHAGKVFEAMFSPDGSVAVVGCNDKTFRLWAPGNGVPIGFPLRHDGYCQALGFSPDSKLFITFSSNGNVYLWNTTNGMPACAPLAHPRMIEMARFSPDGRSVLTLDGESVRRFSISRGPKPTLKLSHRHSVREVVFSGDGRRAVTVELPYDQEEAKPLDGENGIDRTRESLPPAVRLWDTRTGKTIRQLGSGRDWIAAVQIDFSFDNKTVIAVSPQEVLLWDAESGQPRKTALGRQPIAHAQLAPDRRTILTLHLMGYASGQPTFQAQLWNASTGDPILEWLPVAGDKMSSRPSLQNETCREAVFSPDGNFLFTASEQRLRVWDVRTAQQIGQDWQHDADIVRILPNDDSSLVLTLDAQDQLNIWQTHRGIKTGESFDHPKVTAMDLCPDGKWAATAGRDRTVRIWDTRSGQLVRLLAHDHEIDQLVFSPDSRYLVTISSSQGAKITRLWEVATGRAIGKAMKYEYLDFDTLLRRHRTNLLADSATLRRQCFSPDSRFVLVQGDITTRQLCDVKTGKRLLRFQELSDFTERSHFSPDARLLLTRHGNDALQLWDMRTMKPIGPPFRVGGNLDAAGFLPSGQSLWTISSDKVVRIWPIPRPTHFPTADVVCRWRRMTGLHLSGDGVLQFLEPQEWAALDSSPIAADK